jgi:hypothetical protein
MLMIDLSLADLTELGAIPGATLGTRKGPMRTPWREGCFENQCLLIKCPYTSRNAKRLQKFLDIRLDCFRHNNIKTLVEFPCMSRKAAPLTHCIIIVD